MNLKSIYRDAKRTAESKDLGRSIPHGKRQYSESTVVRRFPALQREKKSKTKSRSNGRPPGLHGLSRRLSIPTKKLKMC